MRGEVLGLRGVFWHGIHVDIGLVQLLSDAFLNIDEPVSGHPGVSSLGLLEDILL